jgi:hypothetical protein
MSAEQICSDLWAGHLRLQKLYLPISDIEETGKLLLEARLDSARRSATTIDLSECTSRSNSSRRFIVVYGFLQKQKARE